MLLNSKTKFRAEIDGIRAIAVILATGFQFFRNIFPFGYLGVDIFAVVSGYVITSSLSSRKENNFKEFAISFYERRIKRLLPALLVFILVASFITILIHPNPGSSIRTAIYSLTGISNIYLINISEDYFAMSAELNPFTHTWSLGVEEQFYFIFPFIIWFTGYAKSNKCGFKKFSNFLVFSFSFSFIGFIFLHFKNPTLAYFYTPTRLWQMIIGALSFLAWERKNYIYIFFQKIPSLYITLLLIFITMNKLDEPLISKISITFLTSALLLSLKKDTLMYGLFTNNFSKYLARISYSFYLWRWAIASFLLWTVDIGFGTKLIAIIVLFIIADLSSRLFENQRGVLPKLTKKTGIIFSLFLLELPAMVLVGALLKTRHKFFQFNYEYSNLLTSSRNGIESFDNSLEMNKGFIYNGNNCHMNSNVKNNKDFDLYSYLDKCSLISNNNAKTIFFVGSSHINHLRESHFLLFKNEKVNISSVSISACSFFNRKNHFHKKNKILCGGKNPLQGSISNYYLKKAKKGDIFVVASNFFLKSKSWIEEDDQFKLLYIFNEELKKIGAHLVLIAPSPSFKKTPLQCVQKRLFSKNKDHLRYDNCSIKANEIYSELEDVYEIIYNLPKNIKIFDPIPVICLEDNCSLLDNESKPIFVDTNHYTDYANHKYIYPALREFLLENNLL